jgi:hypothetical protein
MGCLCPKLKLNKFNKYLNEKLNEEPAPIEKEDQDILITVGNPKYPDISQKRKLAEFLISNDFNIFKKHLEQVKQLSDEDFYELFKGNTNHNFNVPNKREFKELAQKFDDNYELISNYYNNEEYYDNIKKIWRLNILQKLKEEEDFSKKEEIMKKIDLNQNEWDKEFKEYFYSIIMQKSEKPYGERIKNYIQADYGNFDDLIKNVNKCKKNVEKSEESHCNKVLKANLDTTASKLISKFLPLFLKNFEEEIRKMPDELRKKEEQNAYDRIKDMIVNESDRNKLIKEVEKIYAKEITQSQKENATFGFVSEFEELKILSIKFTEQEEKEWGIFEDDEEILDFKEVGFSDKAQVFFKNNAIKHAYLGLSLANLTYSLLHLGQTFMNKEILNNLNKKYKAELDRIENNFRKHQSKVEIIPDDIDEAIEKIIELGKIFQADLDEINELISNIENDILGVQTEKNKSIFNAIGSGLGGLLGIVGMAYTEGNDRKEYAGGTLADILALIANCSDISVQQKIINDLKTNRDRANNLKKEIEKEIDKLRQKFEALKCKHYS